MTWRPWPQGLIGRVILVMMGAVLIEFVASSIVFERIDIHTTRAEQAHHLAEQLVVVTRVLNETPELQRPIVAQELSSQTAAVRWGEGSFRPPERQSGWLQRLQADMIGWEPSLAQQDLRLDLLGGDAGPRGRVIASVRMADGSRVHISSRVTTNPWEVIWTGLGSVAVLSVGVMFAAILLVRSFGGPLRSLAQAAENVGKGAPVHVREEGAGDLRRVAQAFNAMQSRINDLLAARTHALAAVSHDLRTPLARLRLRASFVSDSDAGTREALERDVDEMSHMLDSLLAYLGGRGEAETPRLTDLATLCMTVVDAAVDAGATATYHGPGRLAAMVRVSLVKRAFENLVQNALIYGGRADVSLLHTGDRIVLRVEDAGPGIPEADHDRVREAFERLDVARARNTAGLGLGLSIVQRVADQEGGEFVLMNRPSGGLCAELRLPAPH
ncbi:MAG: HAMP domain-containing protein [Alphaproteobacteria bacterium]|nr:HAMP domain-containing protein [Alphaproteobacteria bacterium]MBU1515739.1 HAMP domain-containing protein [Alphaproteobacteria bacterium]MBU2097022.1 HAMP domain-containing protein [Alphaproteobacteria bacterium]MBU2149538.1 HAMP domain-containing protein [Alphaproteobacteria bacterium]MBU2308924.1 HAMP domain-containing protein [Alphaproteobacteria bacterium]